jgi:uncharacterized protein YbbC (DUF1343 family)
MDGAVVMTGAEVLAQSNFAALDGMNVGLITNHTAMVGDRHLADLLHEAPNVNLVALFAPEHGIRGELGGSIDDEVDPTTGVPIFSLYGETREPTAEMLAGIDVLLYDIQDIGPRFYTYISTMGLGMQGAAKNGVSFMVLDRPNPLGGELAAGFVSEPEFTSFIAFYPIPVTHGLTIGELAVMAKEEGMLEGVETLDLQVIEMEGWYRDMLWPDTGREFIRTSPNMPDFETALIYPGACFWERVSGSEGRGTPEPFILLGTEWADAEVIVDDLNARNLSGLRFEPTTFTPEGRRGGGRTYHGIRHVITDPYAVRPVEAGIHVLHAFYTQSLAHPDEVDEGFLSPRISSHAGSERLYDMMTSGALPEEIIDSWANEVREYDEMRSRYFLYDSRS